MEQKSDCEKYILNKSRFSNSVNYKFTYKKSTNKSYPFLYRKYIQVVYKYIRVCVGCVRCVCIHEYVREG